MDKSFRYKQLDQLLRYEEGYTLNELVIRLDDDISKRTLQREIEKLKLPPYNMKFVEDMYRGREKVIRYKDISKSLYDIQDEMQKRFNEVTEALDKLSGTPQYDWMRLLFMELSNSISLDAQSIISFDNNYDLVGLEYLSVLSKAIVHKQPQKIVYKTFSGHELEVNVHPYHLRQFRNRWFLLCMTDGKNYISNYPLDRIESISPVSIPYLKTNIDFDEWFDDVVGVTVRNTPLVEVLIKVNNDRYGYIKTKPLHPSQTERRKQAEDGYTYITIKVKVNSELISLLASFGADIEVVSPYSVRGELKEISEEMYRLYHDEQ